MRFAVNKHNDPAQGHINGGSEQGRRDEKEKRLDNVWAQGPVGRLAARLKTTTVTNDLNLR